MRVNYTTFDSAIDKCKRRLCVRTAVGGSSLLASFCDVHSMLTLLCCWVCVCAAAVVWEAPHLHTVSPFPRLVDCFRRIVALHRQSTIVATRSKNKKVSSHKVSCVQVRVAKLLMPVWRIIRLLPLLCLTWCIIWRLHEITYDALVINSDYLCVDHLFTATLHAFCSKSLKIDAKAN